MFVLAAGGDDDVFLAAGDVQKAVVVESAEVAGVQPTVHQRLACRVRVVVVAVEDVGAFDQDFVVVGDSHLDSG